MSIEPWISPSDAAEWNFAGSDLVPVTPDKSGHPPQPANRLYRVRTHVLSDCDIAPGDLLCLQAAQGGELPFCVSIAAVELQLDYGSVLLLRLFVPPRQLIINSAEIQLPPLFVGHFTRIAAASPWRRGILAN